MPAAPTLTLTDWIQGARSSISNDEYIKCAVSVALELTNRLCVIVGMDNNNDSFNASSSFNASFGVLASSPGNDSFNFDGKKHFSDGPSLLILIEDIVPDNIIVVSLEQTEDGISCAKDFTAAIVDVKPATSGRDMFETPKLTQRSVCFALGKILFELFSQGDPLFILDMPSVINGDQEDSFGDLLNCMNLGEEDGIMPSDSDDAQPATKKSFQSPFHTTMTAVSPEATKAKACLEERGMPLSICRLVSDLLEAEEGKPNQYISDTALLSLEEAQIDLTQMRLHPQRFLFDLTSPAEALNSAFLFDPTVNGELYGREKELETLMDAAARVSLHLRSSFSGAAPNSITSSGRGGKPGVLQTMEGYSFVCEAIFLSGHSGVGKSSIIKNLVASCKESDWFVLSCKFDRQISPLSRLLQTIDSFFGHFADNQKDVYAQESFARISLSIEFSIDADCLGQLCQLLPNLRKLFPMASDRAQNTEMMQNSTSRDFFENFTDSVGSGRDRICHLLQLIFKAVCCGGYPVVFVLDDLQWSDAFMMSILGDLIQSVGSSSAFSAEEDSSKGGLLLLGSFRDNEVEEDGFVMQQIKNLERSNGNSNVSRLFVAELPEYEINTMLSAKLCLPMRYTRMLAQLVHQKTRGNPLYCVEFLKAIIKENVLSWSVKSRQFTWDDTCIDMHTMSEGVVELLTRKLRQLPHDVIASLKIASCLGQINLSTIELLDLGWFVPNLLESLESAVQEGILEKAGPLFAFSHDMLQESTYQLIPKEERKALHKKIGMSLVQDPAVVDNAELCSLAVDQMNMCRLDDPIERALFSRLNLVAGKQCVAASSYEQARGYFEAGISLLHANPWSKQYSLCLELYEMSVISGYMDGDVEAVSKRLNVILTNASFDDALNSRVLQAKLLASQQQYSVAVKGVLAILSYFGEEFPKNSSLADVTSEINAALPMLKGVTKEKILSLKPMTNKRKLNSMKFMALLVTLCFYHDTLLVPLVACRMMKLAIEEGYCDDTIPGLAHMSYVLLQYSDDVELAGHFGRLCENCMIGNPQEHSLRARLTQLHCTVKYFVEPFQTSAATAQNAYNSARIAGDVDNAMLSLVVYTIVHIFSIPDLAGLHKKMIGFLYQMAKHKRIGVLITTMAYFNTVTALIGNADSCGVDPSIGLKTHSEIFQIAEHTQNAFLMHHMIVNQMYVSCYFRQYLSVAVVAEKYGMKTQAKRVLDFYFIFYQGIGKGFVLLLGVSCCSPLRFSIAVWYLSSAAMCLARDTKQNKWKEIGEKSVTTMTQLLNHSTWNFENKLFLLQAELNYLNGRIAMAESSYKAAIVSAHDHRFNNEEALGLELYGIFLVENNKVVQGLQQLEKAREEYKVWGAIKKADAVLEFIDLIKRTMCHRDCNHNTIWGHTQMTWR